jgi:hypothetical protein
MPMLAPPHITPHLTSHLTPHTCGVLLTWRVSGSDGSWRFSCSLASRYLAHRRDLRETTLYSGLIR